MRRGRFSYFLSVATLVATSAVGIAMVSGQEGGGGGPDISGEGNGVSGTLRRPSFLTSTILYIDLFKVQNFLKVF